MTATMVVALAVGALVVPVLLVALRLNGVWTHVLPAPMEVVVRTGAGGLWVSEYTPVLVFPGLHHWVRVSMRLFSMSARTECMTKDGRKVVVYSEILVVPVGSVAIAQRIGDGDVSDVVPDLLGALIESAVRTVVVIENFDALYDHSRWPDIAYGIWDLLHPDFRPCGLEISVVIKEVKG